MNIAESIRVSSCVLALSTAASVRCWSEALIERLLVLNLHLFHILLHALVLLLDLNLHAFYLRDDVSTAILRVHHESVGGWGGKKLGDRLRKVDTRELFRVRSVSYILILLRRLWWRLLLLLFSRQLGSEDLSSFTFLGFFF